MKPSAPESIALWPDIASAAEESVWSCRGLLEPSSLCAATIRSNLDFGTRLLTRLCSDRLMLRTS